MTEVVFVVEIQDEGAALYSAIGNIWSAIELVEGGPKVLSADAKKVSAFPGHPGNCRDSSVKQGVESTGLRDRHRGINGPSADDV